MSSLPSVAIVILNWNGKNFLEKFLPSVLSSTYKNYSVIIADNGSTDNSVEFLNKNYSNLTVLTTDKNKGFAKGYNDALKQVDADYFILLNSDVEVQPGWIEPIIHLMESDNLIAACQPKLLAYADKKKFEYAGASGGWLDGYGYPFSRGRVFDVIENDYGQYDDVQQIFWATGAALFVKAKAFNSVGGFDEYFFAHQEEIDLCWRLQLAGYKIFVHPGSVVYHVGGGTLPMGDKKKVYLNFRNNLVMLSKNLPVWQSFWKIPFRIVLDTIAALKGLFRGSSITFIAITKAHWNFLKWLFFKRKQSIFPTSKKIEPQGLYKGFIVWKYFIKKKRYFSEIVKTKKDF